MPSRVGLYRKIYRMIQEGLCAAGMRRHSKGVYSREITTDATGVVGLNAATKYGFSSSLSCATARLTRNQRLAFEVIRKEGGIPRGLRAQESGLRVGKRRAFEVIIIRR